MDLKQTRIERLKEFARARGVADDPSGLGALIGKRPNQVYNLLSGTASFGEKVARSIEEAAGMPRYWLDKDSDSEPRELAPEIADVARRLNRLDEKARGFILNQIRSFLEYEENGGQRPQSDQGQSQRKQA